METPSRILLVSRWYAPAKNPRAFRTAALLEEMQQRGYKIEIFLPKGAIVQETINIKLHSVSVLSAEEEQVQPCGDHKHLSRAVLNYIRRVCVYLFGDGPRTLLYSFSLFRELWSHVRCGSYDMVLSISYPFYVNVVVALFCLFHHKIGVMVADCGDPFYENPGSPKAFYLKYLERLVLRRFDYITVPTAAAIPAYRHCGIDDRIRVIPQGFRMLDIDPAAYQPNEVPTFCYAGVFYERIRNPAYFFEYLAQLNQDVRFVIYAIQDPFTMRLLERYQDILKDKLVIRAPIDREELIHIMAQMDFVVNFDNDNTTQRPSKLIDYAMSRRPVLSFNARTFQPAVLHEFLAGDYRHRVDIDLQEYDIVNVVDSFAALMKQ